MAGNNTITIVLIGGVLLAVGYFYLKNKQGGGGANTPSTAPVPAPTPITTQMEQQTPGDVLPIPVSITIPVFHTNTHNTSVKSDQFAANIEKYLRQRCPGGSLKPGSSTCRSNIVKYYPEYMATWGSTSDSDTRRSIEVAVANATNCCCLPATMACNYQPSGAPEGLITV